MDRSDNQLADPWFVTDDVQSLKLVTAATSSAVWHATNPRCKKVDERLLATAAV